MSSMLSLGKNSNPAVWNWGSAASSHLHGASHAPWIHEGREFYPSQSLVPCLLLWLQWAEQNLVSINLPSREKTFKESCCHTVHVSTVDTRLWNLSFLVWYRLSWRWWGGMNCAVKITAICFMFNMSFIIIIIPQYRQLQHLSPRQFSIFHHIMLYPSYYAHISLPGSFHEPDSHFSLSAANVTRQDLCLCLAIWQGETLMLSISPPISLWVDPPVKQLVRLLWKVLRSPGGVLKIIFANSTTWYGKIWKTVLDINAAHLAVCIHVWCHCQVYFSSLWQHLTRFYLNNWT